MKNLHLIGIDCQIDFGTPPTPPFPPAAMPGMSTGALYVTGGDRAMSRAAALIRGALPRIAAVHMTLDAHHRNHIANHTFWRDRGGQVPAPFTAVTPEAVRSGELRPAGAERALTYGGRAMTLGEYAAFYVERLASAGRFGLTLWPEHCVIATPGAALVPEVEAACTEFTRQTGGLIDYVSKGSNPLTEHYSAIKAEVPSPDDPAGTGVNARLVRSLEAADEVWWFGIAGDYCVRNTLVDTLVEAGPGAAGRFVIVRDCVASISDPAFEAFCGEMQARGVRVADSAELT